MNLKNKIFLASFVVLLVIPLSYLEADDQLFGGSKEKDAESKQQASKQMVQDEAPIMELSLIHI